LLLQLWAGRYGSEWQSLQVRLLWSEEYAAHQNISYICDS